MATILGAERLRLESLIVRDSAIYQGSAEFRGSVRFTPNSSVNFQMYSWTSTIL